METAHPSMLDLLLETHIGLERQGPGSVEVIEQALEFLKPLDQFSKIADLGCGTGTQTLLLAKYLSGNITGLDIFSNFITIFYKGIMPSEKVLDFPVDCNTLTGSVNL